MVGAQAILVAAVVNGDFDGDGGVDEADDGGRDTNIVCAAAVGGASEAWGDGVSGNAHTQG